MVPSGSKLVVPLKLTETAVRMVPLVKVNMAVGSLSCNWMVFVAFPEFTGEDESAPATVSDHRPPGSLPGVYCPTQRLRVESKTTGIVSLCPTPENRRKAATWPDCRLVRSG